MLENLYIGMRIAAIAVAIVGLVLMLVWRLNDIRDELSGRKSKRQIAQLRDQNKSASNLIDISMDSRLEAREGVNLNEIYDREDNSQHIVDQNVDYREDDKGEKNLIIHNSENNETGSLANSVEIVGNIVDLYEHNEGESEGNGEVEEQDSIEEQEDQSTGYIGDSEFQETQYLSDVIGEDFEEEVDKLLQELTQDTEYIDNSDDKTSYLYNEENEGEDATDFIGEQHTEYLSEEDKEEGREEETGFIGEQPTEYLDVEDSDNEDNAEETDFIYEQSTEYLIEEDGKEEEDSKEEGTTVSNAEYFDALDDDYDDDYVAGIVQDSEDANWEEEEGIIEDEEVRLEEEYEEITNEGNTELFDYSDEDSTSILDDEYNGDSEGVTELLDVEKLQSDIIEDAEDEGNEVDLSDNNSRGEEDSKAGVNINRGESYTSNSGTSEIESTAILEDDYNNKNVIVLEEMASINLEEHPNEKN